MINHERSRIRTFGRIVPSTGAVVMRSEASLLFSVTKKDGSYEKHWSKEIMLMSGYKRYIENKVSRRFKVSRDPKAA